MKRDLAYYRQGLATGSRDALGRAITAVENDRPEAQAVLQAISGKTGRAHVVGITGPPGAGKSTLTSALIHVFREQDRRVAVLAVDPSSPFGGGAILGDRIRMGEHGLDKAVFVRSVASRGHLGGLSRATARVIDVLDGAGFDTVLVETVGTGQAETEIMHLAQTVVVVAAPGLGDEIQAVKAGILEIADIFVVNKADSPLADATARILHEALRTGGDGEWRQPIISTIATEKTGVAELAEAIENHVASFDRDQRSRAATVRARRQLAVAAAEMVANHVYESDELIIDELAERVLSGDLGLGEAAREALRSVAG
ncbi:MAG: methylmalonyl Co-A mutase-associated GTPase MeaB [Actinomycetia bacterium]|nr:methylmalonyl Co-A mutase-associated GTPase MeaB [Actinomycetes bacterium]MCP4224994.1 methylmalonyl Co-A mutase-associated GTPase MeaB [Actinomycetes bacterium]MCP5034622.1 methylmalonyl Co-A mutase-associated GTPase MeaB [Actinomycetes bacterium]